VATGVLQDAHELGLVHSSILVSLVGLVDHLLQLFVSHLLAQFVGNSSKIFKSDVGFLLGEQNEGLLQFRVSIALRHFHSHDLFEVIVVDGNQAFLVLLIRAISVLRTVVKSLDQPLDFLGSRLKSKGAKSYFKILVSYGLLLFIVEEIEGFLNVGFLLLGELSALASCLSLLLATTHGSTNETFLKLIH